jgi:hypothetical protein
MRIDPVDREAALRFLRTAYQPDDWVAIFLKSYETGQAKQRVGPVAWIAEARFQAWLRWLNLLRWNVYVGCNAIRAQSRTRTKQAISAVRHVFVEADHDGAEILARINCRDGLPQPSYVIKSSPGRVHILWRAVGFTTTAVERLQKYLAGELGTDPAATACTQTTRLPGFRNHKRAGHLVTIEYGDRAQVYEPADFPTLRAHTVQGGFDTRVRWRSSADRVERARRYLRATPPAISGQRGDLHTFQVCCRLVRGFALADSEAFALLAEWNARCQPPWSERDLLDKMRRARRYGQEPIGGLLSDSTGVM